MAKSNFKLDCEMTWDAGKGIEIRFKPGGDLAQGVMEHIICAGDELLLALGQLSGTAMRQPQEKVRTKIEIEEAENDQDKI